MKPPARLPVLVLTGFLGSGKTTLLNGLLRQWPRSAVLINEFGAMPLDHELIERQNTPLSVLSGGCLCCQLRDSLPPTLKNLWMAWNGRGGEKFDRLLIETSGVASPEPVIDALLRERWLAPRLHLQGVIATMAVPAAEAHLAQFAEAQAQVAWADKLVLTQTDLAEPGQIERLEARLDVLAPCTPRMGAIHGALDYLNLLSSGHSAQSDRVPGSLATPDHGFNSLNLMLDAPIAWPRLKAVLETLLARHGERLVRVKGIVHIKNQSRPLIVQATAGRLHPAVELPPRPRDDARGRLVFITDGLINELAEELMEAFRGSTNPVNASQF
jgi:G3E family GTPase